MSLGMFIAIVLITKFLWLVFDEYWRK